MHFTCKTLIKLFIILTISCIFFIHCTLFSNILLLVIIFNWIYNYAKRSIDKNCASPYTISFFFYLYNVYNVLSVYYLYVVYKYIKHIECNVSRFVLNRLCASSIKFGMFALTFSVVLALSHTFSVFLGFYDSIIFAEFLL